MMIDPKQYVEKYKNASYLELLKLKNELISCISDFEHDFDREEWSWESSSSPDVGYQLNLELLGLIAPLLKEAFNREYEMGDKSMDDYLNDMKEFYGEVSVEYKKLTSDFQEAFFRFFKPLDYLFSNFFNLLFGVFATNCTFPYKAYTPALFLVIFEVFCIAFFVTSKLLFPKFLI